jgi:hypothetical protein
MSALVSRLATIWFIVWGVTKQRRASSALDSAPSSSSMASTPEDQQRLVDLLVEATEQVMSKQPGYLAANLHHSLDGTKDDVDAAPVDARMKPVLWG